MAWETTQPSLLSRIRNPADKDAWRDFDEQYGELIVRYARSRGVQQSDAEDIRQVVMLNLARAMNQFQYSPAKGKFRNYLGRVVRNTIIQLNSRPKIKQNALDSYVTDTVPSEEYVNNDELWDQEWMRHHYRMAMKTIRISFDPKSIEVFDRLLAGELVTHVATSFNLTTQAVHKIKQRIRNRLKIQIAVQIQEEDKPDG